MSGARELIGRMGAAHPWSWAIAIALLALLVRLPLIFNDFAGSVAPDTYLYLQYANDFFSGGGLGTDAYRTAGYILFLSPISLLPGETVDATVVIQHLLGVGLAAGVFLAAERYFSRPPAIAAALLTAVAPPMFLAEHYVLPDLLFTVVLLGCAVVLTEAALREPLSWRWLVAAGAMFGLAAHVKPTGQILVLAAPLVLALGTRSWRQTIIGSLIVGATMVAVILPWIIHNQVKYDQPVMSVQGGQALWLRVFDQDKLPIPTDSEEGQLAKSLYDEYIGDPPEGYIQDVANAPTTESYSYVLNELIANHGYDLYEAIDLQQDLSLEAIRADPVEYAKGTVRNVVKYGGYNTGPNAFDSAEGVSIANLDGGPSALRPLARVAWTLADVLTILLLVFSAGGLAALVLPFTGERRSRVAAATMIVLWAGVAVAGSLTAFVEARYAVQVAPLQWILQAAAAWLVVTTLVRWWRQRQGAPSDQGQPSSTLL